MNKFISIPSNVPGTPSAHRPSRFDDPSDSPLEKEEDVRERWNLSFDHDNHQALAGTAAGSVLFIKCTSL